MTQDFELLYMPADAPLNDARGRSQSSRYAVPPHDKRRNRNDEDNDRDNRFFQKFRTAFYLFIVFMLVCSDVFIDQILSRFGDSVDVNMPTTKGVVIQSIFMVIAYILVDSLVESSIL